MEGDEDSEVEVDVDAEGFFVPRLGALLEFGAFFTRSFVGDDRTSKFTFPNGSFVLPSPIDTTFEGFETSLTRIVVAREIAKVFSLSSGKS